MNGAPVIVTNGQGVAYYQTAKAAANDGAYEITPLYEDVLDD
jgi:hypothetical protein